MLVFRGARYSKSVHRIESIVELSPMEKWIDTLIEWTIHNRIFHVYHVVHELRITCPGREVEEYCEMLGDRWAKKSSLWGALAQLPCLVPGMGLLVSTGSTTAEILGSVFYQTQLVMAILYLYGIDAEDAAGFQIVKTIILDALGDASQASKLGASMTSCGAKRMINRTVKRTINRSIGRGMGRYLFRGLPGVVSMVVGYSASRSFASRVTTLSRAYISDLKLLGEEPRLIEHQADFSPKPQD